MLKKLRLKFIGIMMTFVVIMLAVIFGLVIFFTDMSIEMQSEQLLQSLLDEPIHTPGPDEVRQPYFVVQVSRRGEVMPVSSGYYDLPEDETLLEITRLALESEEQNGTLEDHDLRFRKATRPTGQMIVFVDMSSQKATMGNLIKSCVLIAILSIGIFLGVSILLAGWAVKPVEQAWQQQKQFVADASHELKTPLAVIMTNAELLQEGCADEESQRQFSGSILTMSRQMRGLVEGLLELARVDNGAVKTNFTELDLSQLVGESLLVFEALYFEKGLILSGAIEPKLEVRGSGAHLRQVLDVLLDNAMKYSTTGGEVNVKLKRQGSHILLSVASPGESISQADLKNIFKRFYRIDQARSRDGSYGLGLSIAQRIVEEHRGKIWAESENGRNTFCVQLPQS